MSRTRYAATVRELPRAALFEARGRPGALDAALAAAGLPAGEASGRIARDPGGVEVLRFGPARRLARADAAQEEELSRRLDSAFSTLPDADVALVSDAFRGFGVTGAGALEVLRQGAPLDLSDPALPPGHAVATELWSATVIVIRESGQTMSFTLLVDASFADYIGHWLAVANGQASSALPGVMAGPPPPLAV
jgi:heterotetrameric sarcosine oxidase gamma subunit